MKRFDSPLTKVTRLRRQEKRLSQMVLARRRTEFAAIEAEVDAAANAARQETAAVGRWMEGNVSASHLQSALLGLEAHQQHLDQIRRREAAAAAAVAAALDDLHEKARREEAVEQIVKEQRAEHRHDAIREQQAALDDHSGRLWHQARLNAARE
jgi:flagellar export protein FliJ